MSTDQKSWGHVKFSYRKFDEIWSGRSPPGGFNDLQHEIPGSNPSILLGRKPSRSAINIASLCASPMYWLSTLTLPVGIHQTRPLIGTQDSGVKPLSCGWASPRIRLIELTGLSPNMFGSGNIYLNLGKVLECGSCICINIFSHGNLYFTPTAFQIEYSTLRHDIWSSMLDFALWKRYT